VIFEDSHGLIYFAMPAAAAEKKTSEK